MSGALTRNELRALLAIDQAERNGAPLRAENHPGEVYRSLLRMHFVSVQWSFYRKANAFTLTVHGKRQLDHACASTRT